MTQINESSEDRLARHLKRIPHTAFLESIPHIGSNSNAWDTFEHDEDYVLSIAECNPNHRQWTTVLSDLMIFLEAFHYTKEEYLELEIDHTKHLSAFFLQLLLSQAHRLPVFNWITMEWDNPNKYYETQDN